MATNPNAIKPELIDELLSGRDPKTLFQSEGLLDELKKALAEGVLNAEMDHHLGQDPEQAAGNHRNGSSSKTVLTDSSKLELSPARSARSFRSATHRQVPAPLPRLRPEGHCLVRPRHEHTRDPGASARTVWG